MYNSILWFGVLSLLVVGFQETQLYSGYIPGAWISLGCWITWCSNYEQPWAPAEAKCTGWWTEPWTQCRKMCWLLPPHVRALKQDSHHLLISVLIHKRRRWVSWPIYSGLSGGLAKWKHFINWHVLQPCKGMLFKWHFLVGCGCLPQSEGPLTNATLVDEMGPTLIFYFSFYYIRNTTLRAYRW